MDDWKRTIAWLAGVGALVGVGRALTNGKKLSWRVVTGRVVLGSALSTVVALLLIPYPDAPMPVSLSAGAAIGILEEGGADTWRRR